MNFIKKNITPIQSLILGFIFIVLLGAVLLHTQIASAKGTAQPFIDSIFVSTSAVTTTGLSVVDIGSFYSLFGQIIIMILIQIGGLGYMIFIVWFSHLAGSKLSIKNQLVMHESINRPGHMDIMHFSKVVIVFTFLIELIGTLFLGLFWSSKFSVSEAFYFGAFHSVSAFCTAGFALFSDGFNAYQRDIPFQIIINILCIAGGIGFFVLYDIYSLIKKKINNIFPRILSIHTRFVIFITIFLIISGTFIIFFTEGGLSSSIKQTMLDSVFQVISASSTTGFNTVTIKSMHTTSILILIILMFIGASPGSTGGGIKTTSIGVLFLSLFTLLKEGKYINLFKRRIPDRTVQKAASIAFLAIFFLLLDMIILTAVEKASFIDLLFEVVSAEGTVGLSLGITSTLTILGKLIITTTMLIGRVGPLAVGFSLIKKDIFIKFRYPEEDLMVG